jgi:hypothetical protein
MYPRLFLLLVLVSIPFVATFGGAPAAIADGQGPHKLTGLYVEFCSCDRFCESAVADGGRRAV